MKLSVCLLLAVVAAASADQGFYQQQYAAQSAPQTVSSYPSFDGHYKSPLKKGWLNNLLGMNRRQDLDDLLAALGRLPGLSGLGDLIAAGPFLGAVLVTTMGVAAVATAGYVALTLSGRGLVHDEWELDHSVWMDQLQKDLEDSWSTR